MADRRTSRKIRLMSRIRVAYLLCTLGATVLWWWQDRSPTVQWSAVALVSAGCVLLVIWANARYGKNGYGFTDDPWALDTNGEKWLTAATTVCATVTSALQPNIVSWIFLAYALVQSSFIMYDWFKHRSYMRSLDKQNPW